MYLTRIAGIETTGIEKFLLPGQMYLTRIAGIETFISFPEVFMAFDVSYPHSGN